MSIKDMRLKSGYSQKYVAEVLGVTPSSVCNWQSGKSAPTAENVKRLAELFGVDRSALAEEIFFNNPSENPNPFTESSQRSECVSVKASSQLIATILSMPESDQQRVRDFIAGLKSKE